MEGSEYDFDDLGSIDMDQEGSQFDLLEAEKKMFAEIYAKFLDGYKRHLNFQSPANSLDYLNHAKVILNSFKRYAEHDDELFERVEDLEEEVDKKIVAIKTGETECLGLQGIDEVKEVVEDLRHAGNLKMPQKSSVSEDQAWRKSV